MHPLSSLNHNKASQNPTHGLRSSPPGVLPRDPHSAAGSCQAETPLSALEPVRPGHPFRLSPCPSHRSCPCRPAQKSRDSLYTEYCSCDFFSGALPWLLLVTKSRASHVLGALCAAGLAFLDRLVLVNARAPQMQTVTACYYQFIDNPGV